MLSIREKKCKDIEKDVYKLLKDKGLNERFTTIINLNKEWIVPYESCLSISINAGNCEGWYVCITGIEAINPKKHIAILSFRVHESLDSAISIQNALVRNIQL